MINNKYYILLLFFGIIFYSAVSAQDKNSLFVSTSDKKKQDNTRDCNADFNFVIDSISYNTVYFNNLSTYDTLNTIYWNWYFGDGMTSSLQNISHTYLDTGSYIVCLLLYDQDTCSDTLCKIVSIQCNLGISYTKEDVTNSGAFDGSIDVYLTSGIPPYNYIWSNGASFSSLSQLPEGIYCVTVTDNLNCTATECVEIKGPVDSIYFSLYGQVHAGSNLLLDGMAQLYNADADSASPPADTCHVFNGDLFFHNISKGNYTIRAVPGYPFSDTYIPTWYVNGIYRKDAYTILIDADTYSIDIYLHVPADIRPLPDVTGNLLVYPNPLNDYVNVELALHNETRAEISLCDITGKILQSDIAEPVNNRIFYCMDVSGLPGGFYFLMIRSDHFQFPQIAKLVK